MAFVTVEDLYGSIECVAFPRVYEKIKPYLGTDTVVRITGKIDIPSEKLPVVVIDSLERFTPPEERKEQKAKEQTSNKERVLWLDARALGKEDFEELLDTVQGYPGSVCVKILNGGKRFEFHVNATRAFLAEIRTFLPQECVKFV